MQAKYDILATSAIKFLTSVSGKQRNMGLFTEATQKDIVEHIVVKNLTATEADEELFEVCHFLYMLCSIDANEFSG